MVRALFEFTGHSVDPIGIINLALYLGEGESRKTRIVIFVVLEAPSTYNVILGGPSMDIFAAMALVLHQKIKFSLENKIGEVRGNQKIAQTCYIEEVRVE